MNGRNRRLEDARLPAVVDVADRLLAAQGELDPVEYLLQRSLLSRPDYVAWRQGARQSLQALLALPAEEVVAELQLLTRYAQGLDLTPVARTLERWGATAEALPFGALPALAALCGCVHRPRQGRMQLDLFADSAWTAASKDIRRALCEQRWDEAQGLLEKWAGDAASASERAEYRSLLEAGRSAEGEPAERLQALEAQIEPLARKCLGTRAADYLSPLWSALGAALRGAPVFVPAQPRLHASYAFLRAGDWSAALQAVETAPGFVGHAELLVRGALASFRLHRAGAERRFWSELCWRHAEAAAAVLDALDWNPALRAQWLAFCEAMPGLDAGDFPAWLALFSPARRDAVPREAVPPTPAGRAYLAMLDLLRARDDVDARRTLRQQSPALFEQFLGRLA